MDATNRWGLSQQKIKAQNTLMLFGRIRREGPVSRASLAKDTGLSATTVSQLVEEMIARRWVQETGTGVSSFRGRKPILLEVDPSGGYVAVLDIRGRSLLCGLYDLALEQICIQELPGHPAAGLKALLRNRRLALSRLLAIHIIFPGLFDPESGRLRSSTVIAPDMLPDTKLAEHLRGAFSPSRVLISNDTSAIAYWEFLSGGYTPGSRLLTVCVNEGISASAITGDVRRDASRCIPLELGHLMIQRDGPLCLCGNRGCLEALCSVPALLERLGAETGVSLPHSREHGAPCNRESLRLAAASFDDGNPAMEAALDQYCESLCRGLMGVVNLLDIHRLHVGGDITLLGDRVMKRIQKLLWDKFHLTTSRPLSIAAFAGDEESIRRAAATMAVDRVFGGEPPQSDYTNSFC